MLRHWFCTNWSGILFGPILWILLFILLGFTNRQVKNIKEWFIGMPIIQWPAHTLVIIGCKYLLSKRRGVLFMSQDGRIWLSPNVEGFKLPEPIHTGVPLT